MDLGNIIYIIAVIGYFIYQATKNKNKKQQQSEMGQEEENEPRPAVSFEDLLKEIRGEQRTDEAPKPEPAPRQLRPVERQKSRPEPIAEPTGYQSSRYEKQNQYDDEIQYYEDAYELDAFEKIKKEEDRIAKVAASIPSQRDDSYALKSAKVSRYAELLKNKDSLKDAIVLNEILKRRHF